MPGTCPPGARRALAQAIVLRARGASHAAGNRRSTGHGGRGRAGLRRAGADRAWSPDHGTERGLEDARMRFGATRPRGGPAAPSRRGRATASRGRSGRGPGRRGLGGPGRPAASECVAVGGGGGAARWGWHGSCRHARHLVPHAWDRARSRIRGAVGVGGGGGPARVCCPDGGWYGGERLREGERGGGCGRWRWEDVRVGSSDAGRCGDGLHAWQMSLRRPDLAWTAFGEPVTGPSATTEAFYTDNADRRIETMQLIAGDDYSDNFRMIGSRSNCGIVANPISLNKSAPIPCTVIFAGSISVSPSAALPPKLISIRLYRS